MIPLVLCRPHPPTLPLLSPLFLSSLSTNLTPTRTRMPKPRNPSSRRSRGICLSELSADAPFAIAIGASMLSSLVLPATGGGSVSAEEEEEERGAVIGPRDTRFAVMSIISLIPYFNWLSWIFAWMDTGKRRYAVYAIVYLAPYFRSSLSLSPEESWLPIASIVLCIVHVQLEASISSGNLDGFRFFNEIVKHLSSTNRREDGPFNVHDEVNEGTSKDHTNLPFDREHLRAKARKWRLPKTPFQQLEHENEDGDAHGKGKD
ncbi:hypothetical protein Dimus_030347 [Dionaea muscipula]